MNEIIEAAGQQFFFNVPGEKVTAEVERFVEETRPGGVVLFGWNLRSAEQTRRLTGDLQRLARRLGLPPFVIAVDEEGGRVSRMPGDLAGTILPSQMAQAAAGGAGVAARCAQAAARRLRRLGFTMNLAPVADVNNNPANPVIGSRSYGSNPARVGECVAAAVAAHTGEGIASCAKHFPGHGDAAVDSHFGLPLLDKSVEELERVELPPFVRAIEAGVPAIMTAHILFPRIDASGRPATLSSIILRGLLREKLGFEGLIFTDALDMRAISENFGQVEAARLALGAGACLMAPVGELDAQYECHRGLVWAAEAGEIDVRAEAARVAAHKERWVRPLLAEMDIALPAEQITEQVAAEVELADDVARRSVTVLRNDGGLLPLDPSIARRALLIDFTPAALTPIDEARQAGLVLENALRLRWSGLSRVEVSTEPSADEADEALGRANGADLLVLVVRGAARMPPQAALAGQLMALGVPCVVIAARDPYDLAALPEAPAFVATYGDPPASMSAVAGLLCGEFRPAGVLPVELPGLLATGAGVRW